jgi:hypothetical protein
VLIKNKIEWLSQSTLHFTGYGVVVEGKINFDRALLSRGHTNRYRKPAAPVPESVLKKRKLVEKLAAERAAQKEAQKKVFRVLDPNLTEMMHNNLGWRALQ